jgi:hypothetical protein
VREGLQKTPFLRHVYIKTIILPRQARDKHRESTQKKEAFFAGCFIEQDKSALAPCNDNVTSTTPPVEMTLDFADDIPPSWLGLTSSAAGGQAGQGDGAGGVISCDVFDVYGCPAAGPCGTDGAAKGLALGRFTGNFSAMIPSHGVRFLRLSGCSGDASTTATEV